LLTGVLMRISILTIFAAALLVGCASNPDGSNTDDLQVVDGKADAIVCPDGQIARYHVGIYSGEDADEANLVFEKLQTMQLDTESYAPKILEMVVTNSGRYVILYRRNMDYPQASLLYKLLQIGDAGRSINIYWFATDPYISPVLYYQCPRS